MEHKLYIVGIGPGAYDLLTIRTERILKSVDEIVGYKTYIELIKPYFPQKVYKAFGMGEELVRIEYAIKGVLSHNRDIALISGGDPTVYGMVSPFLEYILTHNISIDFEVVPGITSALAASSRLGAPLANDFAVLSLSDYLIPWGKIVKRLKDILMTGIEVVLYNPVARDKEKKIHTVKELILNTRGPDTKIGIVENAERKREKIKIIKAWALSPSLLSMRSILFISGKETVHKDRYLFVKRGYKIK